MKILKVESSEKFPTRFYIYVWAPDEYRWKAGSFAFKYEDERVLFLIGGQDTEKNRKPVGEASNKEEAIEKAKEYLMWWLKECKAIGTQEILDVSYEEAGGRLTFSLWIAHLGLAHLKKGPYTFRILNDEVFFLSGGTEASQWAIEHVESRDQAISKAKDFLEWWLDEGVRVGIKGWPVTTEGR